MHCAGCHQIDARGGFVTGARVPPLQSVPATQIAEAVRIGPYLMPRFSTTQISNSQLNSIVKYVLSTEPRRQRRRLGDRKHRPDPGGAGRVVDRGAAADLVVSDGGAEEA